MELKDDKTEKLEQTQTIYDDLLGKISRLCGEAEEKLKQINREVRAK